MKRIIKWHSQHLEIDPTSGKIKEAEEPEYEDPVDSADLDYDDEFEQKMPIQNVMSTPFGFWRVDDSMNPYRQFKLWMGYTNFSITDEVVNIVKVLPGVEVLHVIGRYRFILGVGELFDIRDVRTSIETTLKCNRDETTLISDDKILEQVHQLKDDLSVYNQWAIYVFPNGQIDFTTSEQENFGQQLNLFKQAVDHSNGVLIEGDNE